MNKFAGQIRIHSDISDWDSFVESHPHGSILHTSAMIRSEMATQRHTPYAYGALDENGNLCALLVAVRVATLDGLASPLATRSIMYAEPIFRNDVVGKQGARALILKHDEEMKRWALFSEVRPLFDCPGEDDLLVECGYEKHGYLNYELRLDRSEAELFNRMNAKRRNNVRSAIRHGVSVREVDMRDGLDAFYQLVNESYARSRVPVVDRSLFDAVAQEFPGTVSRLLIAYYQGLPVATGCFLAFKNRVLCWFAGTHRIKGVYSTSLLFWEAIKTYSAEGYEIFDLAGGGWEGEAYGVGDFKEKFGGEKVNHGRYRKVYAPWRLKVAESVYGALRGWVSPKASLSATGNGS
ncbi:MAG: peptidoglycan bridge formation glycyltransferase FemA/FemB family protein [Planctomycetaceae bacterium]|nr:peptidoglycan bridge formation glycyltransferase FemA/FemB family protein [Planctomycetaceae bacterium]